MSQFDFPRINFHGPAYINVGTANNDDYLPSLMLNDIINCKAYTPPRVYVTTEQKTELENAGHNYTFTAAPDDSDLFYVEIDAFPTDEDYVAWARTPLGTWSGDQTYWPLYTTAGVSQKTPGEWNYNGNMSIRFQNTSVVSVTTKPTDNSGSNNYLTSNASAAPADIQAFLGASLNAANPQGSTSAGTISDVNPSAPYSSQFFYDGLQLKKGNTVLMQGQPSKGITRWINFGRVINIPGSPMIASGAMFHGITKEELGKAGWSQLESLFTTYGDTTKTLKGAFIRYSFYEVYESRDPDYATQLPGFAKNPAIMTILGSITPWYEGEMCSASMGRVLNPTKDGTITYPPAKIPATISPIMFNVDTESTLFSADLVNSLHENRLKPDPNTTDFPISTAIDPSTYLEYELTEEGQFDFQVNGSTMASINLNGTDYTIDDFVNAGGILDTIYDATTFPVSTVTGNDFSLSRTYMEGGTSKTQPLQAEEAYYFATDQNGLYLEQGDTSSTGMAQGTQPVPLTLRCFHRGVPIAQSNPVAINMYAYGLNSIFGLVHDSEASQTHVQVYDGYSFSGLKTSAPMLYVNQFVTVASGIAPDPGTYNPNTDYYANVRVLPNQSASYAKYYKDGKPDYSVLTWDALYAEIFRTYYLLFPGMTEQLSLKDASNWESPIIAGKLQQVISTDMWMTPWYMPRNRTLSAAERKLINDWIAQY